MMNLYYYILSLSNNKCKTDILAHKKYMQCLVGKMVTHDTYTEMWAAGNRLGDTYPPVWRLYHDGRRELVKYGDVNVSGWWKKDDSRYHIMISL